MAGTVGLVIPQCGRAFGFIPECGGGGQGNEERRASRGASLRAATFSAAVLLPAAVVAGTFRPTALLTPNWQFGTWHAGGKSMWVMTQ